MRRVAIAISLILATLAGYVVTSGPPAHASSHREAPYTSTDPQADATDLYAFVSPDKPDTVTFIANYIPLEVPAGGPNFYRFGDDVLYEINIDNNGDARDDLTFQFRFRTEIVNGDTFLYNTGPITSLDDENLNQRQFYSLSLLKGDEHLNLERQGQVLAENLQVAPANVGPVSYPQGYEKVARQAIYDIGHGMTAFAGPRDDPFFVDLGGIFDLLQGIRGEDDLSGFNVHTLALQVPIKQLTADGKKPSGMDDSDAIIGVRTTAYRRTLNVLHPPLSQEGTFDPKFSLGPWVQISRLDMPLVNEVVIPLEDKDRWNASQPENDTQFLDHVQNPELAGLLNGILGVKVPDTPRQDLVTIFLTGIPDLNQPKDVTPSSQLRLNMAVEPVKFRKADRLGVLAGDNAGFPNGRRPIDDVVDIELQAVAGATPLTPEFADKKPNNELGDQVNENDVPFLDRFPYLNVPHDYADTAPEEGGGS